MVYLAADSKAKKISSILSGIIGYSEVYTRMNAINCEVRDEMGKHNYPLPTFTITVTTNKGRTIDAEVIVNNTYFRSELFSFKEGKYIKNKNMVQLGRKPRNGEAEFFTITNDELYNSPEYQAVKKDYAAFVADLEVKIRAEVERRIVEEFTPKVADFDPSLVTLLDMNNEELKKFFVENGWEIDSRVDFTDFNFGGWIMSSMPDGYGHAKGEAVEVDYRNKKIYIYGYSSDD